MRSVSWLWDVIIQSNNADGALSSELGGNRIYVSAWTSLKYSNIKINGQKHHTVSTGTINVTIMLCFRFNSRFI